MLKPASLTPLSALNFVSILQEAGIPPGRREFCHRRRRRSGRRAARERAGPVVSFTGSTEVGRTVSQAAAPSFKKTHLEMGGKNVIMIMDDADLDLAVDGCLWGGFGTTGQRCTAASRVVVHEKVYRSFLERFVAGPGRSCRRRPRSAEPDGTAGERGTASHRDEVCRDRDSRRAPRSPAADTG